MLGTGSSCNQFLLFQDLPSGADDDLFHRDALACQLHSPLNYHGQAGTTRDFHDNHSDALDGSVAENLRKLLDITLSVVEFGAADHYRLTLEEISMEVGVSHRCAVRCDKKVCVLKEGCGGWDQPYLDGPM